MFDLSITKFLVIIILSVLLFKTDDLPIIMGYIARLVQYFRFYSLKIRRYIDEIIHNNEVSNSHKMMKVREAEIVNSAFLPAVEQPAVNIAHDDSNRITSDFYEKEPLINNAYIQEIRQRLIYNILFFIAAFCLCLYWSNEIFNLMVFPFQKAYFLYDPTKEVEQITFIFTAPLEYFLTQIQISFFIALILSIPFFFLQFIRFILPALYQEEIKIWIAFAVGSILLFFCGIMLVYFVLTPGIMLISLNMQQFGVNVAKIEFLGSVSAYAQLLLRLMMVFGMIFQLPIMLLALVYNKLLAVDMLVKMRKYAILAIFIISAVVTPPDVLSQLILALPTLILYELTILIAKLIEN